MTAQQFLDLALELGLEKWEWNGKVHYCLPSKHNGRLTLITIFEDGEVCLMGSMLPIQNANRKHVLYWQRVSNLQVHPDYRNVLRSFWSRVKTWIERKERQYEGGIKK